MVHGVGCGAVGQYEARSTRWCQGSVVGVTVHADCPARLKCLRVLPRPMLTRHAVFVVGVAKPPSPPHHHPTHTPVNDTTRRASQGCCLDLRLSMPGARGTVVVMTHMVAGAASCGASNEHDSEPNRLSLQKATATSRKVATCNNDHPTMNQPDNAEFEGRE